MTRYFVNVASFGLSARIARRTNRPGLFGGRLAFAVRALLSLIGWRSPRLRLIADPGYDEIAGITLVAIANGRWFAAGRKVAPAADLSDGKFDIVIAGGVPRRWILKALAAFGGALSPSAPDIRAVRAARFTAAPTLDTQERIEIETDGESAGLLPATFEILPSALNLRV
jgi:diacylglycerol kinase (ATP)